MSVKLDACKHCGGEAELDTQQSFRALSSGKIGHAVAIYCTDCGIQATLCYDDYSGLQVEDMIEAAVEIWNKKPS